MREAWDFPRRKRKDVAREHAMAQPEDGAKYDGVNYLIELKADFLFSRDHERTSRLLQKTEVLSSQQNCASNGKKHSS